MTGAFRAFPLLVSLVSLPGLFLTGCGSPPREATTARPEPAEAQHVGGARCVSCHRVESNRWAGSHHDLAMQEANEQTVLGDFDDATFTYAGITSTFFRREGRFWVETDGPDGELAEYPIAYTFGVEPLQQYLIEFPDGRFQALSICWDTRPASEGGQRWFHLYPDQAVDHSDELHWTGPQQNWNYMCAECHSTRLVKGYVQEEDRYETTWSEIDVSCEACHGPGSLHLAWAEAVAREATPPQVDQMGLTVRLKDPGRGTWMVNPETGKGMRLAPPEETGELDTCARCHSRRGAFSGRYVHGEPIGNTHRVALLEEGLYHSDGQILDEVYVYGSYLQSKMYQAGVTCSDCHEPHGLGLIFPGDKVCSRCHTASVFEARDHHFHEPGTEGSRCVDCHMPPKNYMVVDPRHDHSLRIPRPDLSVTTGVPNACNRCHREETFEWAARAFEGWYGPDRLPLPDPLGAIHAGRTAAEGAEALLAATLEDSEIPGIVRATAVSLLPRYLGQTSLPPFDRSLSDPDPLVRAAAARALQVAPPDLRLPRATQLLDDPIREVRQQAARALAGTDERLLTPEQQRRIERGLAEYRAAQRFNAERAEAWLNLGTLEASLGDFRAAETFLRKALTLDPQFVPAYLNLADTYRVEGRDDRGLEVLRLGLEAVPESAPLHHALGLLHVRRGETDPSLRELERAASLAPEQSRYAYVFGVALHSAGETDRALAVLEEAHARSPADRPLLQALATIYRDAGAVDPALRYARKLLELAPGDPGIRALVQQLERSPD